MKQYVLTILSNGLSKSKSKHLDDFTKYLYPLKYILTCNQMGWITCNDNAFWSDENRQNRIALIHDISNIRRAKITDLFYFRIINRFENGDKYGIVVNK